MPKLWVVMLQFGSGPRCSIEEAETEPEAVSAFAAVCLRQKGVALPLMAAHTAELSRDRLSELLNGKAEDPPPAGKAAGYQRGRACPCHARLWPGDDGNREPDG